MNESKYHLSAFFFRKDLRLVDNLGLNSACNNSTTVIPLYTTQLPQFLQAPNNPFSQQFIGQSIKQLNNQLEQQCGSRLQLYDGTIEDAIEHVVKLVELKAVYINHVQERKQEEIKIAQCCKRNGLAFQIVQDNMLVPISKLPAKFKPYKVFTAFYNKLSLIHVPSPTKTCSLQCMYQKSLLEQSTPAYIHNPLSFQPGGRKAGLQLLKDLPKQCEESKFFPSYKGTTRLSPHINNGTVSIRQVFYAIHRQLKNNENLVKQLYAREFYIHLFIRHGFGPIQQKYKSLQWPGQKTMLKLWKQGRTGFPMVDAGMRLLNRTGFMHKRMRYITSQFFVKDLMIDWREGQKYFAQTLQDYDPILNNAGWQLSAAVGSDNRPYFLIYNPFTQSEKFDRACDLIKQQIPELKEVPNKHIHAWDKHYMKYQEKGYPAPCVNHESQKQKFYQLYNPFRAKGTKDPADFMRPSKSLIKTGANRDGDDSEQ